MAEAAIDTTQFIAHSTISASASKARVNGLSIKDILKRENRSKSSTWQKRYYNFAATKSELFQDSIRLQITLRNDKDGVLVNRICDTDTIGWDNSALDQSKFYEMIFPNFVRPRHGCNKIVIWE